MRVVYQSPRYDADLVTGTYVRCMGAKPNYVFRVFECATGTGHFAGKPGQGPTLREYDTDGAELDPDFAAKCIASKQTERWR